MIFTHFYDLETPEAAAFFSLWREYHPLDHYTHYDGKKITKNNRKEILATMKKTIIME